jgi:hypothetical protein
MKTIKLKVYVEAGWYAGETLKLFGITFFEWYDASDEIGIININFLKFGMIVGVRF